MYVQVPFSHSKKLSHCPMTQTYLRDFLLKIVTLKIMTQTTETRVAWAN